MRHITKYLGFLGLELPIEITTKIEAFSVSISKNMEKDFSPCTSSASAKSDQITTADSDNSFALFSIVSLFQCSNFARVI